MEGHFKAKRPTHNVSISVLCIAAFNELHGLILMISSSLSQSIFRLLISGYKTPCQKNVKQNVTLCFQMKQVICEASGDSAVLSGT